MNKIKVLCFSSFIMMVVSGLLYAQRFTAYYTKLDDNYDALEMVDEKLFGKYADIIVELEDLGIVEFSRKTSYLPQFVSISGMWTFPELIERSGDGGPIRPDIISRYSGVRLIESSEKNIIVHWRYYPDFKDVEWDGVVDEYFYFTRDGLVTRTFRKGTTKLTDWENSSNIVNNAYRLSIYGIETLQIQLDYIKFPRADPSIDYGIIKTKEFNPRLSLSFDDGIKERSETVHELISGNIYNVQGNKAIWRKGVSGSALQFDGYYSTIILGDSIKLLNSDAITIESWVALGAYPFGWAPLVHQSEWGDNGIYLGIDEDGFPGFHISINGVWISTVDSSRLELSKWYNVTGTYSRNSGQISLFVNGVRVKTVEVGHEPVLGSDTDLMIGLNREKMPAIEGRIRRGKWPSLFGIDGLIDEVKIYDYALSESDIKLIYQEYNSASEQNEIANLAVRKFPSVSNPAFENRFGAEYRKLRYYESWDNLWRVSKHPDIVVHFKDLPVKLVSWRGTSYGPYFVTENNKWVGDQSNEDYRLLEHPGEAEGCLEHMSDKQTRHSYIRIIENTDARVVLHWRYGLVDSRYKFAPGVDGWGGWTDEYWTIYPDAVAVRHVERGIVFGDGWVETMFLSAPGTKPEDNVEFTAINILDEQQRRHNLSWEGESPEGIFEDVILTRVNTKSNQKMFNIYPSGSSVEVFGGHSKRSHFHWWNHWPVSQITSDGRGARAADRAAHSSLIWGAPSSNFLMYGISDLEPEKLIPFAKSWNNPPAILMKDKYSKGEYIQEERIYEIIPGNRLLKEISFSIKASENSPLINPSFRIKDWNSTTADIYMNENLLNKNEEFFFGYLYTPQGTDLIVFININFTNDVDLKFVTF